VSSSVLCEKDDHSDGGSGPFHFFTDVGSTETDNVLGENDNGRKIQASHHASAIAADRSPYQ